MKAEKALVILLGRFKFDELIITRIFHIIKNGIDWYDFLNYCIRTNMVCLVYKNMVMLGIDKLLPSTIKYNMRYHYEQNEIRNEFLIASLNKITRGLEEKGVLIVPIKGAKFLSTIYKEDPGVRLLSDIDILAEPSSKDTINKFMKENGFDSYLINNEDALCLGSMDEQCHFYISFTEVGLCDDLRIDFDYAYSASFIQKIREDNYLYELCYLCKSYYASMKKKSFSADLDRFDYLKLVDIHRYYKSFLNDMNKVELNSAAAELHFAQELRYVLECLEQLSMQILIS
uniref:nucleotidyltransferase family protein n=1 Tax=Acetatifactor sp. TaxID=1872090 RepID=UPI0040563AA8